MQNDNEPSLSFMRDCSESDGYAEHVMDYVISWTLRQAMDCNEDEKLRMYARHIISQLISKPEEDIQNSSIPLIRVYKQYAQVDLWIEIEAIIHDKKEHFALIIEDKLYSGLHIKQNGRYQIEDYKKIAEEFYKNNKDAYDVNYILITCIDKMKEAEKVDALYSKAKELNFKIFNPQELIPIESARTKSDIFNEFWLTKWRGI